MEFTVELITRICSRCRVDKFSYEFDKDRTKPLGIDYACQSCAKPKRLQGRRNWYANRKNDPQFKQYLYTLNNNSYQNNKEIIIARRKLKRENNPVCIKRKQEKLNNKSNVELGIKLRKRLRTRLYCALKSKSKKGSAIALLGCTIVELKAYLESKFKPGMCWDNWTFVGWHIDHIKPLASFDLTNLEQLKQACHYTNLQPLWALENLKKKNAKY